MNYEEMSDFEINKCVAEAAGMELSSDHSGACVGVVRRSIGSRPNYGHVNYCNNPSDAWPIIVSMISGWCVVQMLQAGVIVTLQGGGRIQAMDKNTLRAAMIVFLMMQEQAK